MKKAIWLAVLYTAVMGAGKAYVKSVKGVGYSDPGFLEHFSGSCSGWRRPPYFTP